MSLVDDVITRLQTIEELDERVYGAVDLAELIEKNMLPQKLPAAFVIPAGEDAGPAESYTGIAAQLIVETVSVVLIERKAGDGKGEKGRQSATALRDSVRDALLGWSPGGDWNAMEYRRSRFLDMNAGAVFHQSDFASSHQHRATIT